MSKPPTEKQKAARERNHHIWRLRGVYGNHGPLDPDLSQKVKDAIDEQLVRLGAEPEGERRKKRWEELERG